jgi:cytochrome c oxidase subunit 4
MSEHIVSKKIYVVIFGALMALTVLTVYVATFDLGPFNAIVALSIAVFKAMLVVLYFMHVRYSSRLTWAFVGAGFFWLALLFALTLSDYFSRPWLGQ